MEPAWRLDLTRFSGNKACTLFPLKPDPNSKENIVKHKPLSALLVLFLLSSHTSWIVAQQPASANNWAAVQQLRTNEKLVVKRKDGNEVKGSMIEASDTTLTIDRDGKPFGIPRTEVRQVYVISGKAEKGKWALIGAGIGAGAGTGIGAVKYSPNQDDSELWITVGLMIGTGVGALGGMIFGQSKRSRTLVYSSF
jgi:hypothetical protein